jgi:hypothetical protein
MPKRRQESESSCCSSSNSTPSARTSKDAGKDNSLSGSSTADQRQVKVKPRIAEIVRTNLAIADVVLLVVRILVERTANEAEAEAEVSKLRNERSRKRKRDQVVLDVDSDSESGIDDPKGGNLAYRLFLSDGDRVIQGVHLISCSTAPQAGGGMYANRWYRYINVGNASVYPERRYYRGFPRTIGQV